MPITADLSRSDLLLVFPRSSGVMAVLAQAQPHAIQPLYETNLVGRILTPADAPPIFESWRRERRIGAHRDLIPSGAHVVQDVYPVRNCDGRLLALLSVETSLIQLERHRQRHPAFRRAIEWLKRMCLRGQLSAGEGLHPFGEWDGVYFVDPQRRIVYMSGIATNLFRRLGYMEDLRGKRLAFLNTSDDEIVAAAFDTLAPVEREVHEGSHIWIRKVLPLLAPPTPRERLRTFVRDDGRLGDLRGALITIHDATEERRKRQELKVKTTMIQEVHHRVKNNLQAIAAMLRMQARRTADEEALHALNEAVVRILSVAVIHEFLSLDESQTINVRDVCQRIISQNQQVIVAPGARITFAVEGPAIYLPSQQATACALVVNELIHNALEHGFETQKLGQLKVMLADGGDRVELKIWDDGTRLPMDFDVGSPSSLGLQIVQTLVQDDLHGQLRLENQADGVLATVEFPKMPVSPEVLEAARGLPLKQ